jgi:DNA-binding NarL/FixJ family response regulator
LARGKTNPQIAEELYISVNTVSHHLRGIFAKTGSANRTEAAAFALRSGLS